jgi:hypothetical protein
MIAKSPADEIAGCSNFALFWLFGFSSAASTTTARAKVRQLTCADEKKM